MIESNGYKLPYLRGLVNNSFQQWLRKIDTLWLIVSYEWPTRLKRTAREYVRFLWHGIWTAMLKKKSTWSDFSWRWGSLWHGNCKAYWMYSEHILDTFGHFIGIIRIGACKRQKRSRPEMEKYGMLFTTKYKQISSRYICDLRISLERYTQCLRTGITIPAGWCS